MASPIFLGPLTTTFTPPSSCFALTALVDSDGIPFQIYTGGFADALLATTPLQGTDCFPSVYPATAGDNWGPYFSPGVCPSGYTVASSSVNDTETRGICCISGLTANEYLNCQTSVTGSLTASTFVTVKPSGPYPLETGETKVGSSLLLLGSAIEIRWRADGNPPPTAPPHTAISSAATSSVTPFEYPNTVQGHGFTAVGASPETESPSSQTGGLSTNVKIGIGVGVGAAALIAFGIIGGVYLHRRRQRRKVTM
ncbi:hypothetical protein ABW20_dc0107527 [Dactylellina cionopaga]|nr:hypothetical protein ABW20_dc0107527 [Dactylellina cionopaga]